MFLHYHKKYFSIFLVAIILVGFPYDRIFAQDYQLVWSDEFNGTALDLAKWEYQIGTGSGGWGNNEKEYYRSENAVVDSGYLKIIAKKEFYIAYNYTSARIRTIHKGDWKYGKIEMRAKMPVGKGLWPAFWMMPTDNVYGGWAASGEIDIMEYLGHEPAIVHGTLHYGGSWPNNTSTGKEYKLSNNGFDEGFHTYTLIWEEGKIQWLVDGNLYQTQTNWYTANGKFPAPFDQKFHIILNLAVGGNWPGEPDSTTVFPQEFVIDYVRVYQKNITAVQEEEQIPESFSLAQNYPNPFNPTTTINYSIPNVETTRRVVSTTLKVYDTLGKEVATLVNEEKAPGNYKVIFDANHIGQGRDMPSGVYFYRLTAGKFIEIKKMLMMK